MRKTFSSRASSSRIAWLRASRMVIIDIKRSSASLLPPWIYWVGVDVLVKFFWGRLRALLGKTNSCLYLLAHFTINFCKTLIVNDLFFSKAGRKEFEWVAFLVLFDFRSVAVVSRIRHGVPHEAICSDLQQRGQVILATTLNRSFCCFTHGKYIHPIHEFGGHFVGICLLRDVLQRHCALQGGTHSVLIVFADVDTR